MNFCSFPLLTAYLVQPAPHLATLVAAWMTPVIGALGIWIALNQWRTARNKLKLDLYEKRLVVYEAVRSALGEIVTGGKTTQEIEQKFLLGIAGAKWLFNKRMEKYLDELWKEISRLNMLQGMTEGGGPSAERDKSHEKKLNSRLRLKERFDQIDAVFYPFLRLSH